MTEDASLQEVRELGHELASKLTAQLILADLLVDSVEGEASELALQLADELRQMARVAERLLAIGRDGPTAPAEQLPD